MDEVIVEKTDSVWLINLGSKLEIKFYLVSNEANASSSYKPILTNMPHPVSDAFQLFLSGYFGFVTLHTIESFGWIICSDQPYFKKISINIGRDDLDPKSPHLSPSVDPA